MRERSTGRRARAKRTPLSRERIVAAAVALADEKGEAGATMRAIAARLGVEAMSLYNHVAGRDDILAGMVDAVFGEIELPPPTTHWKEAMRDRAASSRTALRRHPWAVGLLDSRRQPGPATLRHHDAVLGALRTGGFSVAMAAHAVSVIDSYLYGFVLQELSLPFTSPAERDEVAGGILRDLPTDAHPYLTELITEHALRPGYDHAGEFEFGLSLILDALHPDEARAEQLLGGDAAAERIFRAVERAVQALADDVETRVSKSQIAFRRRRTFAAVWRPAQYLRGSARAPLVLTIHLPERDDSARWKEVVEPAPGRFTHHLELDDPGDVDEQVADWLRRAWEAAR